MKVELTEHADIQYQQAEERAEEYFESLHRQAKNKEYIPALTHDIQQWKHHHLTGHSWLSFLTRVKGQPDQQDYARYIRWLKQTGKLQAYLSRSVSYIYMRDLGKALHTPDTAAKIQRVVAKVERHLLESTSVQKERDSEIMSMASLYRWAQKKGVEDAVIWMIDKLKNVAVHIPEEMDAEHAQRKLIKIIAGVILHVDDELDEELQPADRAKRLDEAIRLGYSYGLTYPFIDDLLDSQILNKEEKARYSEMIRTALLTRSVPELGDWEGMNLELLQYVHAELQEAFEYIKNYQSPEALDTFFHQAYVFFKSQDIDRVKDLSNPRYSNAELYVPIILKSSSSRIIVRNVISAPEDEGFEERTFYYGIYNQLADDFADLYDDLKDGAVTPYTYYFTYHQQRPDLINPFELYWTVISNLIHNVYHSDNQTCEVILDRAINGLKRCKKRLGAKKYEELMKLLDVGNPAFSSLIQRMVERAEDVDFFDKLLRDQVVMDLRNSKQEREDFHRTIDEVREMINNQLPLQSHDAALVMKHSLIDAANYSLKGDGKRLRPILTWVMGVQQYGLEASSIVPLVRSIEYMHTASLIFDDLPSQDNASTRRGRATLHQVHNSATAELTGLYLIQKAMQEQSSLLQFKPSTVLSLIHYSSQRASDMCLGQAMDLEAKGKKLSLDELNTICFYKTGIAFEASLVMPALLAEVECTEVEALKKYAYHAGIAFQIKDDLLDVEGNLDVIGKPIGQDAVNNTSNFVSVLGKDGARQSMWDHYCAAIEALQNSSRNHVFLKHLLDYIINRDS